MEWTGNCVGVYEGVKVATLLGIRCVIGNILSIALPVFTLAATAMVIFAGVKLILGGDNPKEYAAGMQTLTYAIIGLIGLGLSWVILLVISGFTGADIFKLPF